MKKLLSLLCIIPILASCNSSEIKDKNIAMLVNETPIYMAEYIYNYNYITDYFIDETKKTADSFTKDELALIKDKAQEQILFLYTIKKLSADNNITLSEADNEYITNKIDGEIQLFGGLDVLTETLEALGLTMDKYKEINESGILHSKVKTFYFGADSKNPITVDSLAKSFETDYYRVKHILISKPDDGHSSDDGHGHTDLKTEEEAKFLAQDIQAKIEASEDFDKLMNEYGEDPGVSRNPDGYHFKKGDAVAEFEEASLKLKDNEISDIVETEFGYHIIKRLPLDQNYFQENKDELVENSSDKAMDKLINDTISSFNIKLNDILNDITPANAGNYIIN